MKNSIYISFRLNKGRINKKGFAPINLRVILNGKRFELATHRSISPEDWDYTLGLAKTSNEESIILNNYLASLKSNILRHFNIMESIGEEVNIDNLKNRLTGKGKKEHTLLEIFKYHNQEMVKQVGSNYSYRTLQQYRTTLTKITNFLNKQYSCSDISLKSLNFNFITGFEMYLKTVDNLAHNSAMKQLVRLKKVINLALANEWIEKNPFISYHVKTQETHRGFLTQEELSALENKTFSIPRLQKVKDVFIFCCYTGLSFSDVQKLTENNIQTGIDREKWIVIYRTKNGHRSPVPLLPQAKAILEKYKNDPEANAKGVLLPVNSNQRMNGYLKEIADITGIQKRLTMHLARHTFATTVTLANGVPIETVSKMLGHTSIKTTQIYSKVVDTKISNDMAMLKQKLSPHKSISINQAI